MQKLSLLFLTPGTGHFYCGSCLRDHDLAMALRALGHEVTIAPLYLPLVLEGEAIEPEPTVRMGGINMYLQQKTGLARLLPRFLERLLDRPGLLRFASRRAKLTEAPDLGAMTVSMLSGEDGRQAKELAKLVEWAKGEPRPDAIVLSNALLCGVARSLGDALGAPVLVTLQGEAPFLDSLKPPFAERAWDCLKRRSGDIAAFVPVSRWYGELMATRLDLPTDRVHPIHNGIDVRDFAAEPPRLASRQPNTIGYLARMCEDKGLPTLIRAFLILRERGTVDGLRLRIAGVRLIEDEALVTRLAAEVQAAGASDAVEFLPNISREEKLAFLATLSALSVPATYGESFGLYLLEAMAAGVPVVQPRHGAFPEILEATGGGLLYDAPDAESLADTLNSLLTSPDQGQSLADAGRHAVLDNFSAPRMANEFATLCHSLRR